jgi:protein-S-isoprenylcysteine O-methyltransferase Ste14
LGRYGTTIITVEDDHQLITSGIYGYIRHPIYLGSLLLNTGIILAFGGFFIPLVSFIAWLLLMHDRMKIEEKLLEEKFGEEYLEYKKKRKN